VVQNAESSASHSHSTRRQGDRPPPNKAPTVQGPPPPNPQGGNKALSVHERVETNVDARATLEARRRDRDEAVSRCYRPHRGGRYDPDHDCSTSPEPPGPASVDIWECNKELIRKRTDIDEHFTREVIQSIVFIFLPLGERVHLTNLVYYY